MPSAPKSQATLSFEQIEAFFHANPTLLADHPHLLATQRFVGEEEGNVVNLQQFMVARLQQESAILKATYEDLVRSCRDNLSAQVQIHDAILAVLESNSLESLMQVLTLDLPTMFHIDAVQLAMEADFGTEVTALFDAYPLRGLTLLQTGTVERFMGDNAVELTGDGETIGALFSEQVELVNSAALLRLHIEILDCPAILVFGTRDGERYAGGQGTELLSFFATIIELQLNTCLSAIPELS